MSGLLNLDDIRSRHSLPSVVAGAGVKLIRAGNEFKACCPFHPDKSPSFTIFDGGQRFHCFGCGVSGDVFDYLARLHSVGLREAADMLAGGNLPSVHIAAPPVNDDGGTDHIEEARSIWRNAVSAKGTEAEAYLRFRAIHIAVPDSIRFARLRYGSKGQDHPVLVAVVSSADNKLVGIQRTYLASDGRGKADVPKPKLSLGRISGGAIRLTPCARSLVVCEGLEDGITLQQELGKATWVAAGASMLPNMIFPPGVEQVAIGGDNDEAGRLSARKAAENFAFRGIETRVFFPIEAKDFNAELMEGARG